jgi:hypothetical protein
MGPDFHPIPGAEGWQMSNPPILQMAVLRASMEIFDRATMPKIREKTVHLTGFLEFCLDQVSNGQLTIVTPRNPEERGCHLSVRIQSRKGFQARDCLKVFEENQVICDFREPDIIRIAPAPLYVSYEDVFRFAKILKETKTDVLVNLVPSGSDEASVFYAQEALKAGCSFINCIPSSLATVAELREQFELNGLVLLGDDIKSQIGATMLNRFLLQLLKMRGVRVTKTHQENKGGNADHFNLLYRSEHKEKSKSETLKKFLVTNDATPTVSFKYTGEPSGHKLVNLSIEGEIFGRTPIFITAVIEDEISINGAGTATDAIRVAQFLVDTKQQKKAQLACPFLFKTPPEHMNDTEAFEAFDKLIKISE